VPKLWQDHFAMSQLDFIRKPRADGAPARSLGAFLASCAFHGLLLGSLVALSFMYRPHLPPIRSGSAPGAPTLSMETMVIVSPPPQHPAPRPPTPATALPPPALSMIATTPPEGTVPVLAVPPSKPMQVLQSPTAMHPAISHTAVATAQSSPPKPSVAASPSSYAPGPSVLPHPPYPTEARDRGQTGTVIMNVQFDVKGDVADARVAQSSGVPLLDTATRSFIRAHWHSPAYAGQAVSVPVQYKLENL
jgi:periplasmic protein TonB